MSKRTRQVGWTRAGQRKAWLAVLERTGYSSHASLISKHSERGDIKRCLETLGGLYPTANESLDHHPYYNHLIVNLARTLLLMEAVKTLLESYFGEGKR